MIVALPRPQHLKGIVVDDTRLRVTDASDGLFGSVFFRTKFRLPLPSGIAIELAMPWPHADEWRGVLPGRHRARRKQMSHQSQKALEAPLNVAQGPASVWNARPHAKMRVTSRR